MDMRDNHSTCLTLDDRDFRRRSHPGVRALSMIAEVPKNKKYVPATQGLVKKKRPRLFDGQLIVSSGLRKWRGGSRRTYLQKYAGKPRHS